jgi:hypothetical protein
MKTPRKLNKRQKTREKPSISDLEKMYNELILQASRIQAVAKTPDDGGSLLQPSPLIYIESIDAADVQFLPQRVV